MSTAVVPLATFYDVCPQLKHVKTRDRSCTPNRGLAISIHVLVYVGSELKEELTAVH